jgi:hypothetical protein
MSFIDAAIPGILGLVCAIWPRCLFLGSRATPDPKKLSLIRRAGVVLLVVAAGYLAIGRAGA